MLNDFSWLKRVKILDENGDLITNNNPFPIQNMDFRKLLWTSADDFAGGSLTDTEIKETGDSAYVQLEEKVDNDDDILYNTVGNYTLSDGTKITVDENNSNNAELKVLGGTNNNYPFTNPANYTYDDTIIDITGEAKLKSLHPANATFYASYDSDIDGDWGGGVLTGTPTGGASVSGGELLLNQNDVRYITYSAVGNADSAQKGCIRFGYIPNYTGSPALTRTMVVTNNSGTVSNLLQLEHQVAGDLRFRIFDEASALIFTLSSAWSPTSGVEYEIEVNWDLDAGTNRIFVDGVQLGGNSATGIRGTNITQFRVGSQWTGVGLSNFKFSYLVYFDTLQHSTNYTSNQPISSFPTDYVTNNPTIETVNGFVFGSVIDIFTETATKPGSDEIKYQISSDDGSTWKWWNGSAWTTITGSQTDTWYYDNESNLASVIDTNIGSLAGSGTLQINLFLHSDDGTTTPELDNIYVATPITYSTDDNLYVDTKDASQIAPASTLAWLTTIISNVIPENTDIKLMLSNDGRVSWLTYTGGSWQAPTDAIQRQYGTSVTDAQTNFLTLPLGNGTLDVRIFLYTSDNIITPEVSNINVTSDTGFVASGIYESEVYDSTYFSLDWGEVNFTLVLPSGGTIIITARASNNSGDLGLYGSPLSSGVDSNVTGKYIQWKAVFATSDLSITPMLNDISINFTIPIINEVRP